MDVFTGINSSSAKLGSQCTSNVPVHFGETKGRAFYSKVVVKGNVVFAVEEP
jgi:hypothetical protein